jgi:hypothetical protein
MNRMVWAASKTVQSSSSVASGAAILRLSAMVPVNRWECWGTMAMAARSWSRGRSRMSCPARVMLPLVASRKRGIRFSSVVLPLPVAPTIAVVVPGAAVKVISASTGASAPG